MDGHVAEAAASRERPSESEERLRKKTKQPRERNYGVNNKIFIVVFVVNHQICQSLRNKYNHIPI